MLTESEAGNGQQMWLVPILRSELSRTRKPEDISFSKAIDLTCCPALRGCLPPPQLSVCCALVPYFSFV